MEFKANSTNQLSSSLVLKSASGADFIKKTIFYINLANELLSFTELKLAYQLPTSTDVDNDFRKWGDE